MCDSGTRIKCGSTLAMTANDSRSLNPIHLRAFPFGPGSSELHIRSVRQTGLLRTLHILNAPINKTGITKF